MNHRPYIQSLRCRFCGEFGVFRDTDCCEPCEVLVLKLTKQIQNARIFPAVVRKKRGALPIPAGNEDETNAE